MDLRPKGMQGFALLIKKKDNSSCGCNMVKDGIDTDVLKGKDVRKLQETLNYLGHTVKVTGKFDDSTKEHLKMVAEEFNLRLVDLITLIDYKLVK